ncbi:MAG TPA: four-carbon acid sugar kinase family protein [Candidatus Aerophobetes bacterium]|uniref:Four-carbon acid sugar kinase family protein n=1 Tax=Aerophobetes bacterium TaxID=2030807 RepID=A0A7V5I1L7_UNCAE|nr:four-carbon acid sugar kinase family protein [Candidatus Aerophobetes bacterium]
MLKIRDYRKEQVAAIADDLTGAGEIGSILAENNKKSLVINEGLEKDDIERLTSEYEGIVINLNTRSLNPQNAYSKTKYFLETFPGIKDRLIYKKIDSTLRGNLVEEIEAILDLKCCDAILFAPALPRLERITVGGYHLVNRLPVVRSYYAKGTFSNLQSSYLLALFSEKSKYRTGRIPIATVEKGPEKIIDSIEFYHEKGVKILLSDACTDEDLYNIKEAILNVNVGIIPVGSSGLFYQFFPEKKEEIPLSPPCLVVCGSLNKITRKQVEKLREKESVEYIELDLSGIFTENEKKEKYIKPAREILRKGCTLILATPPKECKIYQNKLFRKKISELLGNLTAEIVKSCKLCGLILTGGSTALSVMNKLETKGVEVKKDIDFLIPAGIFKGGPFEGLPVVTKAGGFGGEDVLIKAVKYLKEEYYKQKDKEVKVE